jgi:hypothetical protein
MLTHAGSAAGTERMSADEEARYDVAHKCIGKYRDVILDLVNKLKSVGPNPVQGSFARLHGGMGIFRIFPGIVTVVRGE